MKNVLVANKIELLTRLLKRYNNAILDKKYDKHIRYSTQDAFNAEMNELASINNAYEYANKYLKYKAKYLALKKQLNL